MMGFLRSPEFLVSTLVGLLLGGGFLFGPVLAPGLTTSVFAACDTPTGEPVIAHLDDQDGARRELAYQTGPGDRLDLCIDVGDIRIVTHDHPNITFDIDVESSGTQAAQRVESTEFALTRSGDTIHLAQTQTARTAWWFGGSGTRLDVEIRVPNATVMAYQVRADVGDITARGLNGTGENHWRVDVGDLDVEYTHLENSTLDLRVDVGDTQLIVPHGPAYHLDAQADVGEVVHQLPDMELLESKTDPPGEHVIAQSHGYDEATTRVQLHLRADVGEIYTATPKATRNE